MGAMKRIAYSGFGLVLSFGLLAPGASAQSQTQPNPPSQTSQGSSLGDYARQVRKDTQPKAKPKVFDNDNLPTEDKLSIVGPATPTPPPAQNTGEAKPGEEAAKASRPAGTAPASGEAKAATEAKAPAPSTSSKPAEEEAARQAKLKEWQQKITAQKDQIDLLQRELDVFQREYQIRAAAFYADAGNRLRNSGNWDKQDAQYKEQIADKQKALEDAKQKLEDLEEEARKAGVPASMREP